jgi:hypothetical protein
MIDISMIRENLVIPKYLSMEAQKSYLEKLYHVCFFNEVANRLGNPDDYDGNRTTYDFDALESDFQADLNDIAFYNSEEAEGHYIDWENVKILTDLTKRIGPYMESESSLMSIFGSETEAVFIQWLSRQFVESGLKHRGPDSDDSITVNFLNQTVFVQSGLMMQSNLWRRMVLEGKIRKTDNFNIPLTITDAGCNGLLKLMNGEKNYYSSFRTLEDIYSFVVVFEYLQFKHNLE